LIIKNNKYRALMLSGFLCFSLLASSQIAIERQVIGSSGEAHLLNGNQVLEQTIGEAVTQTLVSDQLTLTQGFHQPPAIDEFLEISIETFSSSCPTSTDGAAKISEITGCRPPYEIVWSNGITGVDSLDRLLPGLYSVTVKSEFCQETAEFEILAGPEANCALRIFNAFTPDGDGKSDTWTIENIQLEEYSENEVNIFNRWGQKVFSAKNYNNDDVVWNGESESGKKLLTGTFFYVLEAGGSTFKGYVELIR